MGINSDILEYNRERSIVDLCMIIPVQGSTHINYGMSDDEIRRKQLALKEQDILRRQQLLSELYAEYEALRLSADRLYNRILETQNALEFNTYVVPETLELAKDWYLSLSEHAMEELSELAELFPGTHHLKFMGNIHAVEDGQLLKAVVNSLLIWRRKMDNLSTSDNRNLVTDVSALIKYLNPTYEKYKKREAFITYLQAEFSVGVSNRCCRNCGKNLLKDIPFCLHCNVGD